MSTTPTPPEPPEQHGYTGLGRTPTSGAILPVPGNAEIAIWFIVEVVLAIAAARTASRSASGRSQHRRRPPIPRHRGRAACRSSSAESGAGDGHRRCVRPLAARRCACADTGGAPELTAHSASSGGETLTWAVFPGTLTLRFARPAGNGQLPRGRSRCDARARAGPPTTGTAELWGRRRPVLRLSGSRRWHLCRVLPGEAGEPASGRFRRTSPIGEIASQVPMANLLDRLVRGDHLRRICEIGTVEALRSQGAMRVPQPPASNSIATICWSCCHAIESSTTARRLPATSSSG